MSLKMILSYELNVMERQRFLNELKSLVARRNNEHKFVIVKRVLIEKEFLCAPEN